MESRYFSGFFLCPKCVHIVLSYGLKIKDIAIQYLIISVESNFEITSYNVLILKKRGGQEVDSTF